jgi:hypothetical protein
LRSSIRGLGTRPLANRHPVAARSSRGQALAEFALVAPILFLVLGGIIQFGIWFWDQNTLNQVVRDAGRYAATVAACDPADVNDIESTTQAIADAAPFAGTYGAITVVLPASGSSAFCPPRDNRDVTWLSIRMEAEVPIFFPLLPSADIASEARFRMEPQAQ